MISKPEVLGVRSTAIINNTIIIFHGKTLHPCKHESRIVTTDQQPGAMNKYVAMTAKIQKNHRNRIRDCSSLFRFPFIIFIHAFHN